ncbi:spermidine synthase [Agromyces sp. NPDC060279]|uniref:spermidine synthase n=1 Tax=Agromyces sp. NPDC060279 TaxID=3347092 RepID=UPI0036630415
MARLEFARDVFSGSGWTLLVDGTAQSHVDADDPARLFFEYVRRIGHVVDAMATPGAPLRALHLGGGALTIPRYVAATRPGSAQLVVELDAELLDLVLERLPLPAGVETRIADAADAVPALREAGAGFDLVVLDLYSRLEPPAFVADVAFQRELLALLDPVDGPPLLIANVADAAGLGRLREQARAIARARPGTELLVAGDAGVLAGTEEGNAVLVAGPAGIPPLVAEHLALHGPHPAAVLERDRLDAVLFGAC